MALLCVLLGVGGIVLIPLVAWWYIERHAGPWVDSYATIPREERPSMWDRIFGTREPADGTTREPADGATRELAEPQTAGDTWPVTATHEIYQDGRWLPAAGEQYADGRTDIIPVVQWAAEEEA